MVYKGVLYLLPPPGWQGRAEEGLRAYLAKPQDPACHPPALGTLMWL